MYARSASITGRPERLDECVSFFRDEVHPITATTEGCLGLSLVANSELGRCIATSAWKTAESMVLADGELAPLRARAGAILGGEPVVDRWEISMMRRVRPAGVGAWCRIVRGRPAEVYIRVIRQRLLNPILPQLDPIDGYCSTSLFVDRLDRVLCSTSTYESRAVLDANRELAARVREQIVRETGIEFLEVAEFELVLAHLRVPQLV